MSNWPLSCPGPSCSGVCPLPALPSLPGLTLTSWSWTTREAASYSSWTTHQALYLTKISMRWWTAVTGRYLAPRKATFLRQTTVRCWKIQPTPACHSSASTCPAFCTGWAAAPSQSLSSLSLIWATLPPESPHPGWRGSRQPKRAWALARSQVTTSPAWSPPTLAAWPCCSSLPALSCLPLSTLACGWRISCQRGRRERSWIWSHDCEALETCMVIDGWFLHLPCFSSCKRHHDPLTQPSSIFTWATITLSTGPALRSLPTKRQQQDVPFWGSWFCCRSSSASSTCL